MTDDTLKVSYLGITGSYSHKASIDCFPNAHYTGLKKFSDVLRGAARGDVDYAVIPVENSTAGRVTEVYNLLPEVDLHIVGEYLLPIHHCLVIPYKSYRGFLPHEMSSMEAVAWKKSPLTTEEKKEALTRIKEVHSHPQALMQCAGYLSKHAPKAATIVDFDTATAARNITKREDCKIAAIASIEAARAYNLLVIDENIEDIVDNMTRFLIFGKKPLDPATVAEPALTSLIFETGHKPGALMEALGVFAKHGVNMLKLETYMLSAGRDNPKFYVDIVGGEDKANVKAALSEFDDKGLSYNSLGSYEASKARGKNNSFLPAA